MSSPILLEARQLTVPPVIRGEVSFTLREGERFCLYGHSGAGKTTLLHAILGLTGYRGEVVWHVSRAGVGYAGQTPRLIPRATVLQNLVWGASLHGVYLSTHGSRVHELLEQWGLQERRQWAVRRLSAGERVRLELCMAMAVASRLLVVDGLLEQVDEPRRQAFWEEVDTRCARRELSLLYATHSAREAELADRVLILHDGRPLAMDTPEHLRALVAEQPRHTSDEGADGSLSVQMERVGDSLSPVRLVLERSATLDDVLGVLIQRGGWT